MNQINDLMNKAKQIACKPQTVLNNPFITINHAKSLNITTNGPVVIKKDVLMIPVNVFSFISFRGYNKRVILNRNDLSVKQVIF